MDFGITRPWIVTPKPIYTKTLWYMYYLYHGARVYIGFIYTYKSRGHIKSIHTEAPWYE